MDSIKKMGTEGKGKEKEGEGRMPSGRREINGEQIIGV